MSWREAPLYVRCHDLVRWLHERCAVAPDAPWRSVAERIAEDARRLLFDVSLALTFPHTRSEHLERADHSVVRLRVALRLAVDLGGLDRRRHRFAAEELDAVGAMIGGWRKSRRRTKRTGVGAPAAPTA